MIRSSQGLLNRELGVFGATMLGLGSILGTGVFVSIGVAAGVAGSAVIIAIVLAAALATCNALSSAQLAAAQPVSGGTYEYGYRLLHPLVGFTAGWVFLCAKSASAATAALGATGYLAHLLGIDIGGWLGPGAAVAVLVITVLVLSGLRRSSLINIVIVSTTLIALLAFGLVGVWQVAAQGDGVFQPLAQAGSGSIQHLLYATALMFVAYTGYARIATMGEEVRDPGRTIPRAIIATLIVSAGLYVLVAVAALGAVPADQLGAVAQREAVPLEVAAGAMGTPGLRTLVAVGAITAMLGVLLNLVLGLSRVALAMGRRSDLPPVLAGVSTSGTPRMAVAGIGLLVAGIALLGEIETTWAFSALTVLVYYAVTNAAALRLPPHERRYPGVIAWAGLAGCLSLTAFLPGRVWVLGLALMTAGLLWRQVAQKVWGRRQTKAARSSG
ncbi:MAG: APC family permease [Gammaproteobacteria bacterium]|nr:APC family permease [Gammaproteobacteria bacterium]